MSDFFQAGPITTFTRLRDRPLVEVDEAIGRHTRQARAALLVPCLVGEMERPALARICDEVSQLPYLDAS